MKKAQIQGQVFVYILTLVITGAILIFGYNAVKDIIERSEQVEMANFKTNIKSDFDTMASDYGSVKTKTYNVPSKINEVCFYQHGEGSLYESITSDNPLIADSIKDTDNNFFLVFRDGSIDPINLGKIKVNEENKNFICIKPSGNRLRITLGGLGDGVSVGMA
jgi:tRNA G18 (ribose-2'-O)-methylase SpoU